MSKKPSECQVGGEHYKHLDPQPIDVALAWKLDACESAILKYLARHRFKGGAEDLHKLIHYCNLELQHVYGKVPEAESCPVPKPTSDPALAETQEMPTVVPTYLNIRPRDASQLPPVESCPAR